MKMEGNDGQTQKISEQLQDMIFERDDLLTETSKLQSRIQELEGGIKLVELEVAILKDPYKSPEQKHNAVETLKSYNFSALTPPQRSK